jgi:hypothetical protein
MLLKTIKKLIYFAICTAIFNLLTFWSLKQFENSFLVGELAKYLIDFLFTNYYNQFDISIILTILVFIFFIVIDYSYEKSDDNSYTAFVYGNFFGILLMMYLIFGSCLVLWALWYFFIKIPFLRGWWFLLNPDYSYYLSSLDISDLYEFYLGLFLSILYFVVLGLCFVRFPKGKIFEFDEIDIEDDYPIILKFFSFVLNYPKRIQTYLNNKMNLNKISIRIFLLIYLLYLSPSIYVWIYPVLCNWFGTYNYPTKTTHIANTYIFIAGLLIVIVQLIKIYKKEKRELLKEEIKKEI